MTTPTVTPLAPGHFLRTCRSLPNHVIVRDSRVSRGDGVVCCTTDRRYATEAAASIPDACLTVEHTTGRDSRGGRGTAAPCGWDRTF